MLPPAERKSSCRLPIELVLQVLEEAQYDDLVPRHKWLKNYALVCRSWSIHAQRLLFAYVTLLKGSDHCRKFRKRMKLVESRDPERASLLKESIRTLGMAVDHQDIYADVIRLCPNLRELHLSLYHASFRRDVLEGLAAAGLRISALRVKAYHYLPLFQLLPLLPSLEYLEVDCNSILDDILAIPSISPPAWRLKYLRYANMRRHTQAFVEWVLSASGSVARESLEVLSVISPSFELSSIAALGLADTLLSLTVQRLHDSDDLSVLTRLQEIAVVHPEGTPPTFRLLPAGVVHITLDAIPKATECEVAVAGLAAYHERSGGALRALTYNRRCNNKVDGLTDVVMLYDFCTARKIQFRLMDPPYGSYPGERTSLQAAQSFPRELPVSSRRPSQSQLEKEPPWKVQGKSTFARRIANVAGRAFGSSIPPMALARG
ncbi:hypothetical protein DICSQDRAFT_173935 [Dichomitus squalens LYAD-421 SS1]|uniref:F-box domain-containing protein n=2 Tax=Dichomitus squalens TaxID=114155 RepID=A0A4Q9PLY6_9APHY|nr:uncharacterized protein DICSQDRAFT_173935 [Dichomitus squalens LYAD-421 SS1]EJF57479.1 hypothetical protein DICSQDRAFT_173935 [Dichomitus squalens LYAD-421 SS1]TBU55146.1 hypothetical protein BD310DRAFT_934325 [Dichomitus squalens]